MNKQELIEGFEDIDGAYSEWLNWIESAMKEVITENEELTASNVQMKKTYEDFVIFAENKLAEQRDQNIYLEKEIQRLNLVLKNLLSIVDGSIINVSKTQTEKGMRTKPYCAP